MSPSVPGPVQGTCDCLHRSPAVQVLPRLQLRPQSREEAQPASALPPLKPVIRQVALRIPERPGTPAGIDLRKHPAVRAALLGKVWYGGSCRDSL